MKKVLLGTTALIAAAMLPHAAFADDQPAKLSISGLAQFGYGVSVVSEDKSTAVPTGPLESSANLPDAAKFYGLVDISGDTTFKNGIGAGAFIEFYGQPQASGTAGTQSGVKQDWVHLLGASFGEVRFGDYTDARRAKGLTAPQWSQNDLFSANSPDIAFIGSGVPSNTTTAWFGNRFMTEVAYFSPTFDGANLSLSYAPDNGSFSSTGPGASATGFSTYDNIGVTGIRDILSGALTWAGTVSGFTISTDVGATYGSAKKVTAGTISDNPFVWDAGVTVGFGPWNVGGAYEQTSGLVGPYPAGAAVLNSEQIDKTGDVGANYTVGNLTAGVEWSRGVYEAGVTGPDPKAHYTLDTITPGASYIIGPGVDVDAGVAFNVTHDNDIAAPLTTYKGHDAILEFGTEVKF